jgi:hypothetical protein
MSRRAGLPQGGQGSDKAKRASGTAHTLYFLLGAHVSWLKRFSSSENSTSFLPTRGSNWRICRSSSGRYHPP